MTGRFTWTDARVREALGLEADPGTRELVFTEVSTDTRTLGGGALFVALRGERFDGHRFLDEAARRGARAAVVSEGVEREGDALPLYVVEDTLVALGDLARHRRRALPARVLGITGSSGKTTVKELVASGLAGSFRVHASPGNLNNRIGLPLTLLGAPEDAEVVVAELATNEAGEIATLTSIADPDAGLLITVSEAHLEGLGTLEGVLDEKLDLVRGAREGGPVLVGDEPPFLPEAAREVRADARVAGFSDRADEELRGELLDPDEGGRFPFRFGDRGVRPGLPGRHGARNSLLALAMIRLLDGDLDAAVPAVEGATPPPLRGELRTVGGLRLILDCYNANPASVRAALDLLAELPAEGGKVAFLGSMLELGERSAALHREILEEALGGPFRAVVAVGEFARAAEGMDPAPEPLLLALATIDEGYDRLRERLSGGETILLKGSRGLAMERLVERFEEDFGGGPEPGEEV